MPDRDEPPSPTRPNGPRQGDSLVNAVDLLDKLIEAHEQQGEAPDGARPDDLKGPSADAHQAAPDVPDEVPVLDDVALPGADTREPAPRAARPKGAAEPGYDHLLDQFEAVLKSSMDRVARETRLSVLEELRAHLVAALDGVRAPGSAGAVTPPHGNEPSPRPPDAAAADQAIDSSPDTDDGDADGLRDAEHAARPAQDTADPAPEDASPNDFAKQPPGEEPARSEQQAAGAATTSRPSRPQLEAVSKPAEDPFDLTPPEVTGEPLEPVSAEGNSAADPDDDDLEWFADDDEAPRTPTDSVDDVLERNLELELDAAGEDETASFGPTLAANARPQQPTSSDAEPSWQEVPPDDDDELDDLGLDDIDVPMSPVPEEPIFDDLSYEGDAEAVSGQQEEDEFDEHEAPIQDGGGHFRETSATPLSQSLGPDIDRFLAELEALKSETTGLATFKSLAAETGEPTGLEPAPAKPQASEPVTPPPATTQAPASAMPTNTKTQVPESAILASTNDMDKTYDPGAIERRWYARWERDGKFQPSDQGEPFCICLPPPNVTGSLHMGHAFQDTIMDALIRYQRMRGRNTLWQGGTDHAGIATQMVVERQLQAQGKSRHDLGRQAFEEAVWKWKAESGGTITQQLRRLGSSLDWSRERFTLDEGLSAAVREVFVRLYEEGLIYRGKRLVNWDPVLHTAISDLEVVSQEEEGHLWHMRYPLASGAGYVVVATTRPETMLGDTAVAVHPNDDRYRALVGQHVQLPLCDREIPIICDEYVDPEFGSGCVKITPAHDFNDYEIGQRHDLPMINVFTPDAVLNDNAPPGYRGLDRYEARKRIELDLEALGLLEAIEDHRLMIPRGDRTHAVCEPYLTDQWFVKVQPLAQAAIEAVEAGRIRFVPENWTKTYFEWMRNIQDWCISRQLWWGHRIPAWYDDAGRIYVGHSEDQVRLRHKLTSEVDLRQDQDVLDTWFSSALWPFSTLGWPAKTLELKTFYPNSVLVTGFDIIFFWVARMIMMGLKFANDVPFREVYIHGLVRDSHGQKMSKSKGNVLDPLDLIDGTDLESLIGKRTAGLMRPQDAEKIATATRKEFPEGIPAYGTDALRFSFASLATLGRDINFDTGRIGGSRDFCNKIWNAARFVLGATEGADCGLHEENKRFGVAERWIVSRLVQVQQEVIEAFNSYRFDMAAHAIREFVKDDYCDWYIEFSKVSLNRADNPETFKRGTRGILLSALEATMRLTHPIMPFISEEIWQRLAKRLELSGDSIMDQTFPAPDPSAVDEAAMGEFAWLQLFIIGVRRIRAENDITPGKRLPVLVRGGSDQERRWLAQNLAHVGAVANTESIKIAERVDPPDAAVSLAGQMTILVPLADIIDRDVEKKRLRREIDKARDNRDRTEAKLANERFIDRAPEEIVDKERRKLDEFEGALARLREQLSKIEAQESGAWKDD